MRNQPTLQIDVVDRALPDASVLTPTVRPLVVTSQHSISYELLQLFVRFAATEVDVTRRIQAGLVELGRVDSIEKIARPRP
jgi:hypothetical protein